MHTGIFARGAMDIDKKSTHFKFCEKRKSIAEQPTHYSFENIVELLAIMQLILLITTL